MNLRYTKMNESVPQQIYTPPVYRQEKRKSIQHTIPTPQPHAAHVFDSLKVTYQSYVLPLLKFSTFILIVYLGIKVHGQNKDIVDLTKTVSRVVDMMTVAANAPTEATVRVKNMKTNLHAAPNRKSDIITTVSAGIHFTLVRQEKGWVEVELPTLEKAWIEEDNVVIL